MPPCARGMKPGIRRCRASPRAGAFDRDVPQRGRAGELCAFHPRTRLMSTSLSTGGR